MERINNSRRKKVGSNLDQFKNDLNKASDTGEKYSEEIKDTPYNRVDIGKIWDYLVLFFSMLADSFNSKYPVPKKTVLVCHSLCCIS